MTTPSATACVQSTVKSGMFSNAGSTHVITAALRLGQKPRSLRMVISHVAVILTAVCTNVALSLTMYHSDPILSAVFYTLSTLAELELCRRLGECWKMRLVMMKLSGMLCSSGNGMNRTELGEDYPSTPVECCRIAPMKLSNIKPGLSRLP